MKKIISSIFFLVKITSGIQAFSYINDQPVTVATFLIGSRNTYILYNPLNAGNGYLSDNKRVFGIHNMSITLPGYEPIFLIENDVCKYPKLFTMLSLIFSDDNMLVQRWSCVKYILPLSFGFKREGDKLRVVVGLFKYKFCTPFRQEHVFDLIPSSKEVSNIDSNSLIISVNGRSVVQSFDEVFQIYNAFFRQLNTAINIK